MASVNDAPPEVSVVVATYGRAQLLPRLIDALERQTLDPTRFEVVVVDDASPDDTARVLDELGSRTTFELVVDNLPHNRGPAAARNRGLRRARAPVIAFTDDDCVPQPQWLEAGLDALAGRRRLVVGRTVPPDSDSIGPFDRVLRVTDARFMQTCNILYRREDLDELGGFDEHFAWPGGEDTDLGLRAAARGVEPVFAADAVVEHPVLHRGPLAAIADTRRWVDVPLVVRRHPHMRRTHLHRQFFWKRSHPATLVALLGLTVARRHPACGAIAVVPWLRYRLAVAPLVAGPRRRVALLPATFAVDAAEVLTMLRGSLRHRTLVL